MSRLLELLQTMQAEIASDCQRNGFMNNCISIRRKYNRHGNRHI